MQRELTDIRTSARQTHLSVIFLFKFMVHHSCGLLWYLVSKLRNALVMELSGTLDKLFIYLNCFPERAAPERIENPRCGKTFPFYQSKLYLAMLL